MGKFRQLSPNLWPLVDVRNSFLLSIFAIFGRFSSNFASHYRFEIRRNSVKSTVCSEIDHLRCKLGVGGKLFSSFSYNQNCSEVSILVVLL